jgi:hypothetical protein
MFVYDRVQHARTVLVLMIAAAAVVNAYDTGAPSLACTDMLPQHGTPPQSAASPYGLAVSRNADVFTVTLSDLSGVAPFEGFLIEARDANSALVGQFTSLPAGSQYVSCVSGNDAVTHIDPSLKSSVQFTWTASGTSVTGVKFVATAVQTFSVFWTNLRSVDLGTLP